VMSIDVELMSVCSGAMRIYIGLMSIDGAALHRPRADAN